KNGNCLDFDQSAGPRKLRDADSRTHRRPFELQAFIPGSAEDADACLNIHQVDVQLDDVLEISPYRGETLSDILGGLGNLPAQRPRDLPVGIDAQLPCDVDHPSGTGEIDYMRKTDRLRHRRWVDEARGGHDFPPDVRVEDTDGMKFTRR